MKKLFWIMAMVLPMVAFIGCSDDEEEKLPHYPDLLKGAWLVYEIDGENVESQNVILYFEDNYAISKNYPNEGETSYHMTWVPISGFKLTITGSTSSFYMDVYGTTEKKGEFNFFNNYNENGKEPDYICRMKARKLASEAEE